MITKVFIAFLEAELNFESEIGVNSSSGTVSSPALYCELLPISSLKGFYVNL